MRHGIINSNEQKRGRFIVGFFLALYLFSIVAFDNPVYTSYLYITNFMLFAAYAFFKLFNADLNLKFDYVSSSYMAFAIFALSSILWSQDQGYAFGRSRSVLLIAINLFLLANIIKDFKVHEYAFHGVVFGIALNFLIAFGVLSFGWDSAEGWRFQGTTVKSNILANICVFSVACSLFFFSNKGFLYKLYGFAALLMSFYVVILTASKKGLGGALLILFLYILFKKNALRSVLVFSVFISISFIFINMLDLQTQILSNSSFDVLYLYERFVERIIAFINTLTGDSVIDESTNSRIELVDLGINLWIERPILGHGVGGFQDKYGAYAHNNWVDILANHGLVGFFIFYSIYLRFLVRFYKNNNKSDFGYLFLVFLLTLIISEFAIVTYTSKTLMLFILISSLMVGYKKAS